MWFNEKRVHQMKSSLMIRHKNNDDPPTALDLNVVKDIAVKNNIPVTNIGVSQKGDTFIHCPSAEARDKLQPLISADLKDKEVVPMKEKTPTINLVAQRVYHHTEKLKEYINNKKNKGFGVVFARELLKQMNIRFPQHGLNSDVVAYGNFLDPRIKGIHLRIHNKFDSCCEALEESAKRLGFTVATANDDPGKDAKSDDTLTPLEKLKRKYDVQLKCQSSANKFHEEIQSYLAIPEPSEEEEILPWWDDHKKMFPVLYKLAKHYLCIPAASSKSESLLVCREHSNHQKNKTGCYESGDASCSKTEPAVG